MTADAHSRLARCHARAQTARARLDANVAAARAARLALDERFPAHQRAAACFDEQVETHAAACLRLIAEIDSVLEQAARHGATVTASAGADPAGVVGGDRDTPVRGAAVVDHHMVDVVAALTRLGIRARSCGQGDPERERQPHPWVAIAPDGVEAMRTVLTLNPELAAFSLLELPDGSVMLRPDGLPGRDECVRRLDGWRATLDSWAQLVLAA